MAKMLGLMAAGVIAIVIPTYPIGDPEPNLISISDGSRKAPRGGLSVPALRQFDLEKDRKALQNRPFRERIRANWGASAST
jgi:hypothetical protein